MREITMADVQYEPALRRFGDKSPAHFAGRCLLDVIEFLRLEERLPARFADLTKAHAVRLAWGIVKELDEQSTLDRLRPSVDAAYACLLDRRHDREPAYGDDFWDWAMVLSSFCDLESDFASAARADALEADVRAFYEAVERAAPSGLIVQTPGEWFGPAAAVAAYRLLDRLRQPPGGSRRTKLLSELKAIALAPLEGDMFMGQQIPQSQLHWHLGQVVAAFPAEASAQLERLRDLKYVNSLTEDTDRAYAFARILQGSAAASDQGLGKTAVEGLTACDTATRPLGSGVVAGHMKATLNALEAMWPTLSAVDHTEVVAMLSALLVARRRVNRTGILVAVTRELDACVKVFSSDGATITECEGHVEIDHTDYQVILVRGKALVDATRATLDLTRRHQAARVLMVGIAGSLGVKKAGGYDGPAKGDVVVSTSTAAYRVREKVRESATDAPVPFRNATWTILPADVGLFRYAHQQARRFAKRFVVHEGCVVTGNGIKDNPAEKRKVRSRWPGALAVAEEGFAVALECAHREIPYLEIRGISDMAEGDKSKQKKNRRTEARDQERAAGNAASMALALIHNLAVN